MKYAYPQDPTHAVSAIRRYDESSDSSTSQSNLERQQDIAVVGETVPMVFCHRFDWGGDLGVNGGVWISPRLVQLGIKELDLNMMYLLSQGKLEGLKAENTYWGYRVLSEVDPDAQMCYAYEQVPPCLELDYDPGGNLSWTEIVQRPGPSPREGTFNYTSSTDKTIKMSFRFTSDVASRYSGPIVCGPDWSEEFGVNCYTVFPPDFYGCFSFYFDEETGCERNTQIYQQPYLDEGLNINQIRVSDEKEACASQPGKGKYVTTYYEATTAGISRNATIFYTTGIQYKYEVRDAFTGDLTKEGYVWIDHGDSVLTIDGLPPSQYVVEFTVYELGADPDATLCLLTATKTMVSAIASLDNTNQGFSRNAYGNISMSGVSTVTETIYNELEFPDVPGGDQQIVGGLQDLTMLGIKGNINLLRPTDGSGPDYFVQSHIFIEDGIDVERLTLGGTGPSPFLGDLVNHLMNTTQVLKNDQIDTESFAQANRLHSAYKMYFNGVLQTTNSLAEWLTRTAPYFLLTPRQVDGKYGLWPVCPLNGANELSRDTTVPELVITSDDIVQGSYSRSYISAKDRQPVCLIMVYRDQPEQSVGQTVTVEVRYPGTALSGPFEQHDLTEHCCRAEQAVYAARYILAKRRYTTHTVSFVLNRRGAQLRPGSIVKIDLAVDTTDGQGISDSYFYQIDSLAEAQSGTISVEATHFPVKAGDVSVIAYEVHEGEVSIQ